MCVIVATAIFMYQLSVWPLCWFVEYKIIELAIYDKFIIVLGRRKGFQPTHLRGRGYTLLCKQTLYYALTNIHTFQYSGEMPQIRASYVKSWAGP